VSRSPTKAYTASPTKAETAQGDKHPSPAEAPQASTQTHAKRASDTGVCHQPTTQDGADLHLSQQWRRTLVTMDELHTHELAKRAINHNDCRQTRLADQP
jgi:hypothetical protein